MDNIPGEPPPENTPDEETIYPQKPDLTCTPNPTKTKTHRQVVGVANAGGKAYGKATGLYNKHRKDSEQWNPWHPFPSAQNLQQIKSLSQQTKTWLDQHLTHGLHNVKIGSIQCADTLQKLLSELEFGLGDDSWIDDHSHNVGTLYYRDISSVLSSFFDISQFRRTSIVNGWVLQTRTVGEYIARLTKKIGGGLHKISLLLEQ
jgi:hypothetical protein